MSSDWPRATIFGEHHVPTSVVKLTLGLVWYRGLGKLEDAFKSLPVMPNVQVLQFSTSITKSSDTEASKLFSSQIVRV